MSTRILISACLLGRPVRYDGGAKPLHHPAIEGWRAEGRLVAFCPEQAGGLPTPRPPAEIENGMTGEDVLAGRARVLEIGGGDVTQAFVAGAQKAVAHALEHGCRFALLIDGSPSCGSIFIHDGTFSGRRHPGEGVAAVLLRRAGIEVFTDRDVERLALRIEALE